MPLLFLLKIGGNLVRIFLTKYLFFTTGSRQDVHSLIFPANLYFDQTPQKPFGSKNLMSSVKHKADTPCNALPVSDTMLRGL